MTGRTAWADPTTIPRFAAEPERTNHPRRAFVTQVMGLPVSVHVRGPRARDAAVAGLVEELYVALRADDATFSTWRQNSEISRIRRGELRVDDASPRVRQVARLCEQAAERTDGAFCAWLPGPDGGAAFDPTGLVKGWAVQQAVEALVERISDCGPHDVLICAGGDIAASCHCDDTPDWTIGIEDPRDRNRILLTVPIRSGAVATSGTAARGNHITDPATGGPPSGLLSATVVGPSLTWADVYATAAVVRGRAAITWVSTLPDHAAVLVTDDGTLYMAPGQSSSLTPA